MIMKEYIKVINARVIYDRLWKKKNHFEIPIFLPIESNEENQEWGKSKVMLHLVLATEIY